MMAQDKILSFIDHPLALAEEENDTLQIEEVEVTQEKGEEFKTEVSHQDQMKEKTLDSNIITGYQEIEGIEEEEEFQLETIREKVSEDSVEQVPISREETMEAIKDLLETTTETEGDTWEETLKTEEEDPEESIRSNPR